MGKRWPLAKVLVLPVRVQGAEAPPEIAGAIRYCNRHALADLIITGRGGGSLEDLWAFNDELVVRAISGSVIPVISAVGHETDVTLSDFAADLRAATPSNARNMAVPDAAEQLSLYRGRSDAPIKPYGKSFRASKAGRLKSRGVLGELARLCGAQAPGARLLRGSSRRRRKKLAVNRQALCAPHASLEA